MFAVPGWSISAASLVQEQPRSKGSDAKRPKSSASTESRKRKRGLGHDRDDPANDNSGHNQSRGPHTRISDVQVAQKSAVSGGNLKDHSVEHRDKRQFAPSFLKQDTTPLGISKRERRKERPQSTDERLEKNATSVDTSKEDGQLENARLPSQPVSFGPTTQLTPLQAKMRNKLTSARFRHLNEKLYTTNSAEALQLFTSSPELFAEYHAGFAQQVKDSWPQNPVTEYIKAVKSRGNMNNNAHGEMLLPRRKTGSCTIADLGCGDAPLARGCQSVIKAFNLKFHNYDLHAPNSLVTKADMSSLPLRDGEADIAVFCLSLMGTNWIAFVEEAWRILRGDGKGEVWVSEVKSRFGRVVKGRVVENSVGKRRKTPKSKSTSDQHDDYDGPEHFIEDERNNNDLDDETDVSAFIKVFTRRGFQLRDKSVNKRNKMFVSMVFTKTGIPTTGKYKGLKWNGKEYQNQHDGKMRYAGGQKDEEDPSQEDEAKVLKPCVYKTR